MDEVYDGMGHATLLKSVGMSALEFTAFVDEDRTHMKEGVALRTLLYCSRRTTHYVLLTT